MLSASPVGHRSRLGSSHLHTAEELARLDRTQARLCTHGALAAARAAHDDETITLCLLLHGTLSFAEQSFAEAHSFVLEAAAASQCASRAAQARVLVTIAGFWAQLGRREDAINPLEVALTLLGSEHVEEIARVELVLGVLVAQSGAVDEGIARLRAAGAQFARLGLKHQMIECAHNEACALMVAGRCAAALALARETLSSCVSAGETLMRGHVEANVVEALVRLGRCGEALAFARVALSRPDLHARGAVDVLRWCGAAQEGCGLLRGARDTWLRALSMSEGLSADRTRALRQRLAAVCGALKLAAEAEEHERDAAIDAPAEDAVGVWRLRTIELMTAYCKVRPIEARGAAEHALLGRWDAAQTSGDALRTRLEATLARERQQVSFDPVVDLSSGELVALHAHGRLRNERGESANRSEYVLLFAAGAGVSLLTEETLDACCAVLAARRARGSPSLRMVVELGAVEVEHALFVAVLRAALETYLLDASALEVQCVGHLSNHTANALAEVRAAGVAVSTRLAATEGVEALSLVSFDAVELGGTLIGTVADNDRAAIVVQSLLAVARRLHARSRGVGVDDEATLARLRSLGCDEARGAVVGRPLSADEAIALSEP